MKKYRNMQLIILFNVWREVGDEMMDEMMDEMRSLPCAVEDNVKQYLL